MELFVVRHAIAAPYSVDVPDEERPLTPEGRERFRRCVRGLERLGIELDRLLHSPLLRAVQTAEELAGLLRGSTAVTPHLAAPPGAGLLSEIAQGGERVAVVGHEPWTSELVALLAGDRGAAVDMRKGAVAHLVGEAEPAGMLLRALLPPRVLVRVGEQGESARP